MAEFYVYFLIDPRTDEIFYVGKGKGARIKAHVAKVRSGRWDNPAKCRRIAEILGDGLQVVERIHRSGLTEAEAFSLERDLIRGMDGLTNISHGQVTSIEAAQERLRWLKRNLKSYSEWIGTTDRRILDGAERAFGDLRGFYDHFCVELDRQIDDPLCSLGPRVACR